MDSDYDPFNNSDNSNNLFDRIQPLVFNNPAVLFLVLLIIGVALVIGVNYFEDISAYQNSALIIGLTQVVITGYLSFKILSIGKRDSEMPSLNFDMVDVTKLETEDSDTTSVLIAFEIKNTSFGRAGIRKVDIEAGWLERDIEENNPQIPLKAWVSKGKQKPTQLDKNQSMRIEVGVNGLNYLDRLTLLADESRLGIVERSIPIRDISFELNSKRRSREGTV